MKGVDLAAAKAQLFANTGDSPTQDALRWRFTQLPRYFQCGPYDTSGEFHGYSVGIEPLIPPNTHWREYDKYPSVNQCILGRGDTLAAAIDAAIKVLLQMD